MEVLHITFVWMVPIGNVWENDMPWREFFQHFPSVKAIRTEGANSYRIARALLQDHGDPGDDLAFLPALEEVELEYPWVTEESQCGPRLAAFEPFVSARQHAGRPVEVFFSP